MAGRINLLGAERPGRGRTDTHAAVWLLPGEMDFLRTEGFSHVKLLLVYELLLRFGAQSDNPCTHNMVERSYHFNDSGLCFTDFVPAVLCIPVFSLEAMVLFWRLTNIKISQFQYTGSFLCSYHSLAPAQAFPRVLAVQSIGVAAQVN